MFFRFSALALSSSLILAACGGGESTPQTTPAETEKPVENSEVTEGSSNSPKVAPAAETPTAEPSQAFASLPAPYNTADYAVGRRTFKLCSSCHLLEEGAGHLVGPNLYGMFDRKVGEMDGFTYSKVLQEADFEWTPEQVDAWLADPRGFLKGNRMSFTGVRKPADRTAVIAYMMSETGYTADE